MVNLNETVIARIRILNLVEASKFVKKQVYSGIFEKTGESKKLYNSKRIIHRGTTCL